jgi:small-conductance mechanosensitive channel
VLTVIAVRLTISVIKFSLNAYLGKQERAEEKQKQVRGIITITNILFWVLGLIFLLDNLGYNVSAVLAGLGIGGIAIALAAQTILGDLFSYFVIFFDRPFEIGDFIIIGDKMGTVEYVGIKTTRIRSIGGEQLVLSNTDLTNSRIHNYKRMERRRIVFSIGVVYQTKSEQLNEVPKIVKQIIQETPNTLFDRGHFSAFGDFSLNFEFVYFVLSPDFLVYRDTQQAINLKIYEEFEKRGIEFAYPTQTLFLNKETDTSTLS